MHCFGPIPPVGFLYWNSVTEYEKGAAERHWHSMGYVLHQWYCLDIRSWNSLASCVAPELVDKLSTKYTRFRGAFNLTDEYRGPPSPEIDAAWERYDFNRKWHCDKMNPSSDVLLKTGSYATSIGGRYQYRSKRGERLSRHGDRDWRWWIFGDHWSLSPAALSSMSFHRKLPKEKLSL